MNRIYRNIHIKLLLLILVFGIKGLNAQEFVELEDIVVGTAEVSAKTRITLKQGFRAKEGSSFRAYISPEANGGITNPVITATQPVSVSGTPTPGENYVRSIVFPNLQANRNEQITYYDGLGRPIQ